MTTAAGINQKAKTKLMLRTTVMLMKIRMGARKKMRLVLTLFNSAQKNSNLPFTLQQQDSERPDSFRAFGDTPTGMCENISI
jgi:hypothetical protein